MNGAEVVYRPSEAVPMTGVGYPGGGTWMLQNRAHAHFNSVYMLCPNVGPVYLHPRMEHPYDIGGGNSHIVDYLGNVVAYSASGYNTFVSAIVDIEALRQFRVMNLNSNWLKDLRTEVFRRMYEEPIHPANLWLEQDPSSHAEVDEVYRANIGRLVERGTYTLPRADVPGRPLHPAGRRAARRGLGGRQAPLGRGGLMAESYDVVVVGGGHNGLACAGYLAKAGKRVLVLEARSVAGGGCATEEVAAPGFRHNFHSNFHGIIHMGPVYRDLELERYGARYVFPENQFAHVFPDGRAIVCSRERRAHRREHRAVLEGAMQRPSASSPTRTARCSSRGSSRRCSRRRCRPRRRSARSRRRSRGSTMLRHFLSSSEPRRARPLRVTARRRRGSASGSRSSPAPATSSASAPTTRSCSPGSLEPYGWAICVGGSNVLAQAMVRFLEDHGGEVRLDSPVARIEVGGGIARAVELEDGERIPVDGDPRLEPGPEA